MYGIDLIVERQITRWQQRSGMHPSESRSRDPVITISRQHGAGGDALGKSVAAELGFEFWDREVLHEMAEHAHVSERLFESLDEQPKNAIASIVRAISHSADPSYGDYMHELQRQIRTIAHHGHAVIMGRGAQLIVDPSQSLRIRIVAPLNQRIQTIAELRGISERDAAQEIQRIDGSHAAFLQQNWGRNIDDPEVYDMVINSKTLNFKSAVDAICVAYRDRFDIAPRP